MLIKHHQLWILIVNCVFWSMAWNLNQLNLYASDYVLTDVSNYYIRSFLCIKSTNSSSITSECLRVFTSQRLNFFLLYFQKSSIEVPTLIESIWPENLLLIPPKIFPNDLSQAKSYSDCNGIVQAIGTAVDVRSALLWIIDNGSEYCPPKLLVFDLKKNEEVCESRCGGYNEDTLMEWKINFRFIDTSSINVGTT